MTRTTGPSTRAGAATANGKTPEASCCTSSKGCNEIAQRHFRHHLARTAPHEAPHSRPPCCPARPSPTSRTLLRRRRNRIPSKRQLARTSVISARSRSCRLCFPLMFNEPLIAPRPLPLFGHPARRRRLGSRMVHCPRRAPCPLRSPGVDDRPPTAGRCRLLSHSSSRPCPRAARYVRLVWGSRNPHFRLKCPSARTTMSCTSRRQRTTLTRTPRSRRTGNASSRPSRPRWGSAGEIRTRAMRADGARMRARGRACARGSRPGGRSRSRISTGEGGSERRADHTRAHSEWATEEDLSDWLSPAHQYNKNHLTTFWACIYTTGEIKDDRRRDSWTGWPL